MTPVAGVRLYLSLMSVESVYEASTFVSRSPLVIHNHLLPSY